LIFPSTPPFPEQVVATAHTLLEAQTFEQVTQVVEPDGGISRPAQGSPKNLL
jgi:hypothetical protein